MRSSLTISRTLKMPGKFDVLPTPKSEETDWNHEKCHLLVGRGRYKSGSCGENTLGRSP